MNTWTDWYLAPTERPSIQPPSFEYQTIEVPGRDGLLDVSSALSGYPVYGNREGSIDFLIHPDSPYTWSETLSKVSNYLHGQKRKVFLEDDPAYLYEGRFKVLSFSTGDNYSTISIDYTLQPYKKSRWSTIEEWQWDPFNFKNGVILKDFYNNLAVHSDDYEKVFESTDIEEKYRQEAIGRMTVSPTFHVTSATGSGIDIFFDNNELGIREYLHLDDGISKHPEVVFSMQHPDNRVYLSAKGIGVLSIEFYIGSL
jgi:hypothetical protein